MDDCEMACDTAEVAEKYGLQQTVMPYQYTQAVRPPTEAEMAEQNRLARIEQAIRALRVATEIRADAALMAEVRAYIRKELEDLAAFLDTIG